ncbi:hypothetical protein AX16_007905 [Volvariella volvacea WC 439]|nr:hypothetical protein AX16_007905 [Volvariella volvacea WC 439]
MFTPSSPSCFPGGSPPFIPLARSSGRGSPSPGSYSPAALSPPQAPRPGIIPLPSLGPTHIHPNIDGSRGGSPISVNLSLSPPFTTVKLGNSPCPAHLLAEPAIEPHLPSIVLTISEATFPGEWSRIIVRAEDTFCPYVTIDDVLRSLFFSLHRRASGEDYARLPTRSQQLVGDSYKQRYRTYHDRVMYDAEKASGLKRVDWLLGRTKFSGLDQVAGHEPDVWRVKLS